MPDTPLRPEDLRAPAHFDPPVPRREPAETPTESGEIQPPSPRSEPLAPTTRKFGRKIDCGGNPEVADRRALRGRGRKLSDSPESG